MADIGDPVRRHTVIPLSEPITAPEGPTREPSPSTPSPGVPPSHGNPSPSRQPSQVPELEPAN